MIKAILGMLIVLAISSASAVNDSKTLANGQQPQLSSDKNGVIRIVYGLNDQIFCSTSKNNGDTFSAPELVAKVPGMHLGMSRGPQLATSAHYSVITAMDKAGNIHWFRLNNSSGKWTPMGVVNDLTGSAPEGLMDIAADNNDNFYAVWLDIRTGKHNQVYFSSLSSAQTRWSKDTLAYSSPDGHVCECCQPHISAKGQAIAIMFRNWINGSRDLYLIRSSNKGKAFSDAQKLGADTWKLNGCPMDGGDLLMQTPNNITTTWQRKGEIYYCQPGQKETYVGKGRNPFIIKSGTDIKIAFQSNDTLKMVDLKTRKTTLIGEGNFIRSVTLGTSHVLNVWEDNKQIKFNRIAL